MTDNPTTPAAATKPIVDYVEESDKKLKVIIAESESSIQSMSALLTDSVKGAFKAINGIGKTSIEEFLKVRTVISDNNVLFDKFTKNFITFRELTKTKDLFSGLNNSSTVFGTVTDQITAMGAEWSVVTNLLNKTTVGKAATGMLENIKDNAGYGQKAEAQMISMLSAGGQLNKMFNEQGDITGDLATKTLKYVNSLGAVAESNGMTMTSTIKFADAFNRIPGVMEENIKMSDAMGGQMSALNAAMKVLAGTGQSEAEFMRVRDVAYQNLGNSMGAVEDKGRKHIALFATMSALSKDFNLTFNETSDFLGDIAKQFKYVGDNTEAAARVMGRFTEALRSTGLTSSASVDIIKEMVKSVGGLTVGTKAFISARSGGPGGLQGSVQIDKLNREGKSDQVMTMVMNTLKQQFGGRIVTQAEGAQSQEAAAQFTKQKMMIQSGAFGNLVGSGPGSDEKAARLLEALASGNMGKAAKVGDTAIDTVAKQGNNLQKETNTILNKVALASERTAMATQLSALRDVRKYLGAGNDEIKNTMQKDMSRASVATSNLNDRNIGKTGGTEAMHFDKIIRDSARVVERNLQSGINGAVSGGSKLGEDFKKGLQEGGKTVSDIQAAMRKKALEDKITADTPALPPPNTSTPTLPPGTRKGLTVGANQTQPRANVQATVTRNTPNNNQGNNGGTITLKLTPEAARLLEMEKQPGVTNGPDKTMADFNVTGGEPR